jgi:hypothetical protein
VKFFNVVLGEGPKTDEYWKYVVPIHLALKYGPFGFEFRPEDLQKFKSTLGKLTLFNILQGISIKSYSHTY